MACEECNITALTKGEKGDNGATGLAGNGYLTTKVTLTTAQVLELFTTPIQLVATPGVGFAIQAIACSVKLNYNTIAYATNLVLGIANAGAIVPQLEIKNVLFATISKIGTHTDISAAIGTATDTQVLENTALMIRSLVGNPTAGNSSVDIYLTYRIITL